MSGVPRRAQTADMLGLNLGIHMDRSSKLILAALALGLWTNIAILMRPTPASAQDSAAQMLEQLTRDVRSIYNGTCLNRRLCGPVQ